MKHAKPPTRADAYERHEKIMQEIRSGDPRYPMVCNEAARLIEEAVERLGLGVDEAVCLLCQVAADYARSEYGNEYLPGLAEVVTKRGEMPMPERVQ